MNLMTATRICVVTASTPAELGRCLAAIAGARDYREWAYVFSLEHEADVACTAAINGLPAAKMTLRQPPAGGVRNRTHAALAGLRTATKLSKAELIMYVPDQISVAREHFRSHYRAWIGLAGDVDRVTTLGTAWSTVAGSSWRADTLRQMLAPISEKYYLGQTRDLPPALELDTLLAGRVIHHVAEPLPAS